MIAIGDFSFLDEPLFIDVLQYDYNQINNIPGAWSALKNHDTNKSFMFHTNGYIWDIIRSKMSDSHSGASSAVSLRNMEYIAKHGWDKYVKMKKNKD
jgi:hypothetical protein